MNISAHQSLATQRLGYTKKKSHDPSINGTAPCFSNVTLGTLAAFRLLAMVV